MSGNKVLIVQGGQYGSEAKGAAAHALCLREGVKWTCRTGSINAGHSIVVKGEDGKPKKMMFQQLPTGAVIPGVNVVLGPGSYLHHDTLKAETEAADCRSRLYLDRNCGVHLDSYQTEAAEAGRNLRIGATGKGCAEAIVHKIRDRGVGVPLLYKDYYFAAGVSSRPACDTAELLNAAYDRGERILIEGTQGSLLDFHCGPYPYVTSRQTTAAAWVAESGLSPALQYEVVLVVRTYPIRVAGNSGPMPYETTWPIVARRMNQRLAAAGKQPVVREEALVEFERALERANRELSGEEAVRSLHAATVAIKSMSEEHRAEVLRLFETTTVTKRLRRIAELDVPTLRLTVRKERPSYIVLTFLNYVFPELAYTRRLHKEAIEYVNGIQEGVGCEIRYYTVGPGPEDMLGVWE